MTFVVIGALRVNTSLWHTVKTGLVPVYGKANSVKT